MENVKSNFIYEVIYQVLCVLLPILTAPYIARVIGVNGVGVYSYTYSIASYFVLFAKLGIHVYGNRAIAAVRDDKEKLNKTFSELLLVHVIISVVVLMAYGIYAFGCSQEYIEIVLVQAMYVVAELLDINWLYFGLEKFKITTIRSMSIKVIMLISIFIFVQNSTDTWKYCAIMAGGMMLSEFAMWLWAPRYVKIVKVEFRVALKHIKPLIVFFIPSVAVSLYKVMDKIMLGSMSGIGQVGLYENAEKIITMTLSLVTALGTVMMPRMTNLIVVGDTQKIRRTIYLSMKFIMIISIAMACGIAGVAEVFTLVFLGREFSGCIMLMMGLALSMPFTAFANVLRTQYLIPNYKDRVYQISVIAGAAINVVINYVSIPRIHAMGAVIGTVMAELTVCVIQAIYSREELPIREYIIMTIPYLISGIIMGGCVYVIGYFCGIGVRTLLLQVFVGIIIYVILLGGYLYKTNDDILTIVTNKFR